MNWACRLLLCFSEAAGGHDLLGECGIYFLYSPNILMLASPKCTAHLGESVTLRVLPKNTAYNLLSQLSGTQTSCLTTIQYTSVLATWMILTKYIF